MVVWFGVQFFGTDFGGDVTCALVVGLGSEALRSRADDLLLPSTYFCCQWVLVSLLDRRGK